jgi:TRAP-type C4-dicarboxylate transport system permease small subunit
VAADAAFKRWDLLTRWVVTAGFVGLCAVAALTTWDGLARYLSWPRLHGHADFVDVMLAISISTCFPAGLLHRNNITIRFLGSWLPRPGAGVLELFGALVTLGFFALLSWQVWLFVVDLKLSGRTSATIEMALWPWWWSTATLLTLAVPVQAFVLWRSWTSLRGGARLPEADD